MLQLTDTKFDGFWLTYCRQSSLCGLFWATLYPIFSSDVPRVISLSWFHPLLTLTARCCSTIFHFSSIASWNSICMSGFSNLLMSVILVFFAGIVLFSLSFMLAITNWRSDPQSQSSRLLCTLLTSFCLTKLLSIWLWISLSGDFQVQILELLDYSGLYIWCL